MTAGSEQYWIGRLARAAEGRRLRYRAAMTAEIGSTAVTPSDFKYGIFSMTPRYVPGCSALLVPLWTCMYRALLSRRRVEQPPGALLEDAGCQSEQALAGVHTSRRSTHTPREHSLRPDGLVGLTQLLRHGVHRAA